MRRWKSVVTSEATAQGPDDNPLDLGPREPGNGCMADPFVQGGCKLHREDQKWRDDQAETQEPHTGPSHSAFSRALERAR
jgi:hypothetical protein